MESSDQFHESFKQGLTAGYVFAATFVIVFYMSYCLPVQLVKKKNARQKRKFPHQELIQKPEKKRKKARRRQIEKELPVELLEKRIQAVYVYVYLHCTKMASEIKRDVLLQTVLCSLLTVFMVGRATVTDIACLKSIKASLEDPYKYLKLSWNFNNNTEGSICRFNGVECWHPDENKVLNLRLSKMGLKGQFPRGIQNCSSLRGLDLSLNKLTGPIPSDVSSLIPYVASVDLSSNNFNGEIPASFGDCTYLNALKLDKNMLTGQIPQQLGQLPRIKYISFSNNKLSGSVPVFLPGSTSIESYANNSQLCGGPFLPPCSLDDFHQSFKDGLIAGFAFSVTSVIVIYTSYCAPWEQSNRKRNKAKEFSKYICSIAWGKTKIEDIQIHKLQTLQLREKAINEICVQMERMKSTMRLDELRDATDDFSIDNAIGMGEMGIMYEGRLPNGGYLAVKRLFDSEHFKKQFLLEIRILGKFRHRNIVLLLGFCVEREEKILVYQHMSNGRLSKWLHPLESEVVKLKWPERIKIALGVARGLSWLYHSCNLHVVHLNICSECILLDKNFEPKISNFGQAKFMNPNIEDDASMMFFVRDGKKDVYDFGSLLFELITGKTFKELLSSSNTSKLCGKPSDFYGVIDESLIGEGFENEIYALVKVACECVQPFPDQRPTMLEVYSNMSNVWGEPHRFIDDSYTLGGSGRSVSATSINEIVEL